MWTVNVVTGSPGKPASVRQHKFETKREAHAFLRGTPYSFVRRLSHTYTIYPKSK